MAGPRPPPSKPAKRRRRQRRWDQRENVKRTTISAAAFPHIIDLIFQFESLATLLHLRLVSRAWRDRATQRAAYHHILEEGDGVSACSGLVQGDSRSSPLGFYRCFTEPWPFIKHTQVLDLAGVQGPLLNGLLLAWRPKVDTIRFLPSCRIGDTCLLYGCKAQRIVYFDYLSTVMSIRDIHKFGASKVVVHLTRPSAYLARPNKHVLYARSLVVLVHPWESSGASAYHGTPRARLEHAIHTTLGDVVYLVEVAREEDCPVIVVGLEHLDAEILGLPAGCLQGPIHTHIRRFLKSKFPPKEPKAEVQYLRYSLKFQRNEDYRRDVGERDFEMETQTRVRHRSKPKPKVSTCCIQ